MGEPVKRQEINVEDLTKRLAMKPYGVRVIDNFARYYREGDFLGKGTYGEVRKCEILCPHALHTAHQILGPDVKEVAVKVVKKRRIATAKDPEKSLKRLLMELWVLRHGRHPNLLKLVDALQDDQYIYLVTSLVRGDMLLNYLNNHIIQKKAIPMDNIKVIMRQLLAAVHALHATGVVHRDVKLENALIDDKLRVTLIDFGFAKQYSSQWSHCSPTSPTPKDCHISFEDNIAGGVPLTPGIGSVGYTPQDYLSWWIAEKEYKTTKHGVQAIDVFGCGVILYTLVYCRLPFQFATTGREGWKALADRMQNGVSLPTHACFGVTVGEELKELLAAMLNIDPQRRPKAHEVLRHPFLHNVAVPNAAYPTRPMMMQQRVSAPMAMNNNNNNAAAAKTDKYAISGAAHATEGKSAAQRGTSPHDKVENSSSLMSCVRTMDDGTEETHA